MADRYLAKIVPAVGPAIKRGDLGAVVAAATALLRDHPSYTVAIRRDTSHVRHSIRIRRDGDTHEVTGHADTAYVVRPDEVADDLADVTTIITNLGLPARQPTQEHP